MSRALLVLCLSPLVGCPVAVPPSPDVTLAAPGCLLETWAYDYDADWTPEQSGAYTYDADGNMLTDSVDREDDGFVDQIGTYTYDGDGNLVMYETDGGTSPSEGVQGSIDSVASRSFRPALLTYSGISAVSKTTTSLKSIGDGGDTAISGYRFSTTVSTPHPARISHATIKSTPSGSLRTATRRPG
jgi:hypothetical protein